MARIPQENPGSFKSIFHVSPDEYLAKTKLKCLTEPLIRLTSTIETLTELKNMAMVRQLYSMLDIENNIRHEQTMNSRILPISTQF